MHFLHYIGTEQKSTPFSLYGACSNSEILCSFSISRNYLITLKLERLFWSGQARAAYIQHISHFTFIFGNFCDFCCMAAQMKNKKIFIFSTKKKEKENSNCNENYNHPGA